MVVIQFPYACIGQASFLELSIASSPCYPEMLEGVKQGEKLLDLGCAFGRQLIHDGAPSQNLYGCDLRPEFLQLGHGLFLDQPPICQSTFISADILDTSPTCPLTTHHLDIIYTSLFLHVFDFKNQVIISKRLFRDLLRPCSCSLVVCRVVACQDQAAVDACAARLPYYYHDRESWESLWERVQDETGLDLHVQCWEQEDALVGKHPLPGIYMLGSSIRRG